MSIEERLSRLETLVSVFISSQSRKDIYNNYDNEATKKIDSEQSIDIANNRTGIEESYEASLENADDIADVRTALEEVYELITEE